ncbi:MAG TPA: gas vesicle protein K [Candidatus Limnocylindria bacterium]|nr:gas vesicle protein K [Candidatus Limnocylindria bacterium]
MTSSGSSQGENPLQPPHAGDPEKLELELREEIERLRALLPERIDLDPADIERGLAGLVLTLVEFLRQVLERQAIRRMEGGSLSDDEVERVGLALMRLEQKIGEIAKQFGLDEDDIQLRIGAAS